MRSLTIFALLHPRAVVAVAALLVVIGLAVVLATDFNPGTAPTPRRFGLCRTGLSCLGLSCLVLFWLLLSRQCLASSSG